MLMLMCCWPGAHTSACSCRYLAAYSLNAGIYIFVPVGTLQGNLGSDTIRHKGIRKMHQPATQRARRRVSVEDLLGQNHQLVRTHLGLETVEGARGAEDVATGYDGHGARADVS